MRSHFALLVVLLSFLAVGPSAVAGDLHSHPTSSDAIQDRTGIDETPANGTTIRIKPRPNGDAHWNVSMQFALRNENETAAFKQMGRDFENYDTNGGDVGFSADTFRAIATREQMATGRQMKIRNTNRNYFIDNDTGTLTLTFIWTNFTRVHDERIYLHDVFLFNGGNSTWLRSLSADQTLVIEDPDGYRIRNSNIGHNNGTIVVAGGPGSSSFLPDLLDVTYAKKDVSGSKTNYPVPTRICRRIFGPLRYRRRRRVCVPPARR